MNEVVDNFKWVKTSQTRLANRDPADWGKVTRRVYLQKWLNLLFFLSIASSFEIVHPYVLRLIVQFPLFGSRCTSN